MDKLAAYIVREGALSTYDAVGWIVRLAATLEPIHGLRVAHGRVSAKAVQIAEADCRAQGFLLDAGDLADDPAYFSLERCRGGVRSPEGDTWAAGVTLYQALTGTLPFPGTSAKAVEKRILGPPPAPLAAFDVGDDELQLLIDRLFAAEPHERLDSLVGLRQALIDRDASYADLPPLNYGRPEETGRFSEGDELDEDEDQDAFLTTSVIRRDQMFTTMDAVRRAKERAAAKAAAADSEATEPSGRELGRTIPLRMAPATVRAEAEAAAAGMFDGNKTVPLRDAPPALRALIEQEERLARVDRALEDTGATDPFDEAGASLDDASTPDSLDEFEPPPRESTDAIAASIVDSLAKVTGPSASPATEAWRPSALSDSSVDHSGARPAPRRRGCALLLFGSLFMLAGGAVAYYLFGWPARGHAAWPFGEPSVASPPAVSASTGTDTAASASAPPAETGASPPPPSSSSASAAPASLGECIEPLFPPSSSIGEGDYAFVCREPSPHRGANLLRTRVVEAGRRTGDVTEAMREWSNLGWYGMAAFAVIRARCCESPPPLESPTSLTACRLVERLEELATAVTRGSNEEVEAAIKGYTQAVHCLGREGAAPRFGHQERPGGGELSTFHKTVARCREPAIR